MPNQEFMHHVSPPGVICADFSRPRDRYNRTRPGTSTVELTVEGKDQQMVI